MTNQEFTESVQRDIRRMIAAGALQAENDMIREDFARIVPTPIDPDCILFNKLAGTNLSWIYAYGDSWKIERDAYERGYDYF